MHETRFLLPNVEIESQALPKVVTRFVRRKDL